MVKRGDDANLTRAFSTIGASFASHAPSDARAASEISLSQITSPERAGISIGGVWWGQDTKYTTRESSSAGGAPVEMQQNDN